jgi:hypothetical protein
VLLVDAVTDASGRRIYRTRPAPEVAQALRLAYGAGPEEVERCLRGFAKVAELLTAGERAQAGIRAVLLALPAIAPEGMAKLARAAELQKYNPNWADEPRIPAGFTGGGDWTNDGGASAGSMNVRPIATPPNPVQEMKERFVDAHLADTQTAAAQLGVPVENILGLAALESNWGKHRFAAEGNNYFGINYPAPYAIGYIPSNDGKTKFSRFASYADSIKSFIAISGPVVQGIRNPETFASRLQNSGKFGIYDNGAKVPTYVSSVAATIRGLRAIVERRKM